MQEPLLEYRAQIYPSAYTHTSIHMDTNMNTLEFHEMISVQVFSWKAWDHTRSAVMLMSKTWNLKSAAKDNYSNTKLEIILVIVITLIFKSWLICYHLWSLLVMGSPCKHNVSLMQSTEYTACEVNSWSKVVLLYSASALVHAWLLFFVVC